MPTAKPDRPYFDAWLRRTRRQFAVSGRLAQTALLLSREEGGTPEAWEERLRSMVEGGRAPSMNLLMKIDELLSARSDTPNEDHPELFLF